MDTDSVLRLVHRGRPAGYGGGLVQAETLLLRMEKEARGNTRREEFRLAI